MPLGPPMVFHPDYVTPLPRGHRFPMRKFGLLRDYLLASRIAAPAQFHAPTDAPAAVEEIELAHCPEYVKAFISQTLDPKAVRRIGLPLSPGLVRRTRTAISGTLLTTRLALTHGLACNTAGGTHHAHRGFGSGFCIFNDLAIAAVAARQRWGVGRVLVLDLDVHQGDGTAAIFRDDKMVYTFSMHCGKNFPLRKQPGDWDIALDVGTADEGYLDTLNAVLPDLANVAQPELVLYDAGADVHTEDLLGRLNLNSIGVYKRDRLVLDYWLARGVPVACVIGGGYDVDHQRVAIRHSTLHRAARDAWRAAGW